MDPETVRKVARISRLKLTAEEMEEFSEDLEQILEHFSVLDEFPEDEEIEVERIGFTPIPVDDVLREDEEWMDIEAASLREMMDIYEEWVRGPKLS